MAEQLPPPAAKFEDEKSYSHVTSGRCRTTIHTCTNYLLATVLLAWVSHSATSRAREHDVHPESPCGDALFLAEGARDAVATRAIAAFGRHSRHRRDGLLPQRPLRLRSVGDGVRFVVRPRRAHAPARIY